MSSFNLAFSLAKVHVDLVALKRHDSHGSEQAPKTGGALDTPVSRAGNDQGIERLPVHF